MTSVTFSASDTPVSDALAVLDANGVTFAAPVPLVRTRLDTRDGRLHAAGLRLEVRVAGPSDTATTELVLTDAGVPAHLPLPERPAAAEPLDPTALPRGPFRARVLEASGTRPLLPQVTVTSQRSTGLAATDAGAPRAVVHLDRALVVAGVHAPLAWAAEVALVAGHEAAAADIRAALEALPAHRTDGDVLELALALAGVDPLGSRRTSPADLTRRMPALHGFRSVLRLHGAAMEAASEGVATGADPDELAELCRALEHTRVLLVDARRVVPAEIRTTATHRLGWLDETTRPVRHLDVCLAAWPALIASLDGPEQAALEPLHAQLHRARATAQDQLAAELRSARAAMVRRSWHDWLAEPDDQVPGGERASRPLGAVVAARLEEAHTRITALARTSTTEPTRGDLDVLTPHVTRLACLLAAFAPIAGRRRSTALLDLVDPLADQVHTHRDVGHRAEVVREALADLVDRRDTEVAAATAAAADRLVRHLDAQAADARSAVGELLAAYDRKRARRTVADALERMRR